MSAEKDSFKIFLKKQTLPRSNSKKLRFFERSIRQGLIERTIALKA